MKSYSPTYVQGDTIQLPISWTDADDNPIPLLGRVVRFAVRETAESQDALYDKNSTDHPQQVELFEINDITKKGLFQITLTAAESSLLPIGDLPYNVEVLDQDGFLRTILAGRLMIVADIAR